MITDSRPEVRVTQVVFYDQIGHVVPFDFDADILSRGLEIYLSGYFKMLTDDDPLCENGIPVTQVGKFSLPYARHDKPRLVYFLPHFSLRFIL